MVFTPGVPGLPPGASWAGDGTDRLCTGGQNTIRRGNTSPKRQTGSTTGREVRVMPKSNAVYLCVDKTLHGTVVRHEGCGFSLSFSFWERGGVRVQAIAAASAAPSPGLRTASPREERRDRRRCRQAAHVVPNRGACMAFVHVFVPWADRRKRQGFPRPACLASCSGRLVPHATSRRCGSPGRPRDSPSRSRFARPAAAPPGGPGRRCRARGSPARSYGRRG
jgi:hypothetical protein